MAKTKTDREPVMSGAWELAYRALLPVAVAVHNAASDINIAPTDVVFHFGDPDRFMTDRDRADLCYIKERTVIKARQSHVWINPTVSDWAEALASIVAGLYLHYNPEMSRGKLATGGGKKAEQRLTKLSEFLTVAGFDVEQRSSGPVWKMSRDNFAADLAATAKENGKFPEPLMIAREESHRTQGNRYVRLECSERCRIKPRNGKPYVRNRKVPQAQVSEETGLPCCNPKCKGTFQPVKTGSQPKVVTKTNATAGRAKKVAKTKTKPKAQKAA